MNLTIKLAIKVFSAIGLILLAMLIILPFFNSDLQHGFGLSDLEKVLSLRKEGEKVAEDKDYNYETVPPIDQNRPSNLKTATLALG